MKINVLGTNYKIEKRAVDQDRLLETKVAYCDPTTKKIVISEMQPELGSDIDIRVAEMATLRHEIIHAFLYESGLYSQSEWGTDETLIDWIALQYPKMKRVFAELEIEGCS